MTTTSHRGIARRSPFALAALIVAALLGPLQPAAARPLEDARCTEIQAERDKLVAGGVRAQMTRGPAWARDNLPREAVDRIAQLIDLDEQLMFRCPLKFSSSPLKVAKPETDEDDEKDGNDTEQKTETAPSGAKPPADPAGVATSSAPRRPQRGPGGVPLPERRPSGADAGEAAPALRGSLGAISETGVPGWANSDGRSR